MQSQHDHFLTFARLFWRSLRWHARSAGVLALAVAVSMAVLAGALVVGWSLQRSLEDRLVRRLAGIQQAITLSRPAPVSLLQELGHAGGVRPAGALELRAVASSADEGEPTAIPATVWGIAAEGSWRVAGQMAPLAEEEAIVNAQAAESLNLREGDELLVRVDVSSLLNASAVFTPRKPSETTHTLRLRVARITPPGKWGDFTLAHSQSAPANVLLPLQALSRLTGQPPAINRILLPPGAEPLSWQNVSLASLGFVVRQGTECQYLLSPWIELPARARDAVKRAVPDAVEACTFIAEETKTPSGRVSYGVVLSTASADLAEDRVVLNEWVAEDLGATVGGSVEMTFLIPRPDGTFSHEVRRLHVARIAPIGSMGFDPAAVPDVAGMTEAKQIDAWKTPFPVDMGKVTPRDEQYWEAHRATPKAMLSDRLMQQLWGESGFAGGRAVTAMVLPGTTDVNALREALALAHPEWAATDVLAQAQQAGQGSSDFAGLFLGMSLFLVVAALIIAAALVRLGVESRAGEFGLAGALGISARAWQVTLLLQNAFAGIPGVIVGIGLGVLYAGGLLRLFALLSADTWALPPISLDIRWGTLAGVGIGVILFVQLATAWQIRRQLRRPVRELLWGMAKGPANSASRSVFWQLALALVLLLVAAGIAMASRAGRLASGDGFFLAAVCLLISLWLLASQAARRSWLGRARGLTVARLCLRFALADRRRLMLSFTTYAVASFTLSSVALYQSTDTSPEVLDRAGPAGGFAYRITSPIAYRYDLGTEQGRQGIGMEDPVLPPEMRLYSLPTSSGAEGGCLNLAQPAEMQVVGITPAFAARGGFDLRTASKSPNPWAALDEQGDAIAVFADADTAQWILKRSLGDEFTMPFAGRPTKLKLAGTLRGGLFSGQLLMSEANHRRLFPADAGYRLHFAELRPAAPQTRSEHLPREDAHLLAFRELGMVVEPTPAILRAVGAVQRIYMTLFLVLGGLGLLLGLAGSTLLLIRDSIYRKSELALLQATGLGRGQCASILAAGHLLPLAAGLVSGLLSATLAYVAIQTSRITPWGLLLPLAAALLAALLMLLISRVVQPHNPGECLRCT